MSTLQYPGVTPSLQFLWNTESWSLWFLRVRLSEWVMRVLVYFRESINALVDTRKRIIRVWAQLVFKSVRRRNCRSWGTLRCSHGLCPVIHYMASVLCVIYAQSDDIFTVFVYFDNCSLIENESKCFNCHHGSYFISTSTLNILYISYINIEIVFSRFKLSF